MTNNDCPCRYCVAPKRHVGCHITCPEYKKWNIKHQQELDALCKSRDLEDDYLSMIHTNIVKRRKK
jgi:hypothetical protein